MTRLAAIALVVLLFIGGVAVAQTPWPGSDTFAKPSEFLACSGNPYALCYYSGPNDPTPRYPNVAAPALPCTVESETASTASCTCYAITEDQAGPFGTNFVLIGSILNTAARDATIEQCGESGDQCLNMANFNSCQKDPKQAQCQTARVCAQLGSIQHGTKPSLYSDPAVDLISTFSFTYSFNHPFGSTNCAATPGRYAGCMTAPCTNTEDGLTTCTCPVADGPYQVGQSRGVSCDISPNVWSAADNLLDPQ